MQVLYFTRNICKQKHKYPNLTTCTTYRHRQIVDKVGASSLSFKGKRLELAADLEVTGSFPDGAGQRETTGINAVSQTSSL